jgi:hypothetical protein
MNDKLLPMSQRVKIYYHLLAQLVNPPAPLTVKWLGDN